MIGLLIAVFACIYFYVEAKKRGEPPFTWSVIAFLTFMGPQIVISWFLVPFVLVKLQISLEDSQGMQILFGFITLGIGFYLLVVARKKLYTKPRLIPTEGITVINSIEITDNPNGTFTVGKKTFSDKADAKQYVSLLNGLL